MKFAQQRKKVIVQNAKFEKNVEKNVEIFTYNKKSEK